MGILCIGCFLGGIVFGAYGKRTASMACFVGAAVFGILEIMTG